MFMFASVTFMLKILLLLRFYLHFTYIHNYQTKLGCQEDAPEPHPGHGDSEVPADFAPPYSSILTGTHLSLYVTDL